jgi:Prokaryotic RING finger family 1
MRAAAINFKLESVHCPFCRSHAEKPSALIVCSGCKTYYHRECWFQNQGCSVFGCNGIMRELKKGISEPKWLSALRIVVFGFIVFSFASLQLSQSLFVNVLFAIWAMLFMPAAPILLLSEIICLYQFYEHPNMRSKYGRPLYHVLSLSGYCLIIFLFFVSMFLLPFMI